MASSSCNSLTPYNGSCATSFPAGMIRAGSFNRSVWLQHGVVVGDEIRAVANLNPVVGASANGQGNGPHGYGPDVNQPRDPRNGRNGELQSEDPFLTGQVALYYVQVWVCGCLRVPLPRPLFPAAPCFKRVSSRWGSLRFCAAAARRGGVRDVQCAAAAPPGASLPAVVLSVRVFVSCCLELCRACSSARLHPRPATTSCPCCVCGPR
jgi:hypothetical protein